MGVVEGAVSMKLCESCGRFCDPIIFRAIPVERVSLRDSTAEEDLTGEIARDEGFDGLKDDRVKKK